LKKKNEEAIRIATMYKEDFGCMLHAKGLKNGSALIRLHEEEATPRNGLLSTMMKMIRKRCDADKEAQERHMPMTGVSTRLFRL